MPVSHQIIRRNGVVSLLAGTLIVGATVVGDGLFTLPMLTGLLFLLAGLCGVIAGWRETLSVGRLSVTWHQLAGISYLVLAPAVPLLVTPQVLAGTATTPETVVFFTTIGLGTVLAYMGVDILRGGKRITTVTFEQSL